MKQIFLIGFIILIVLDLHAQNPIVRAGVYVADPAAHVWDDGRIYLYVPVNDVTGVRPYRRSALSLWCRNMN